MSDARHPLSIAHAPVSKYLWTTLFTLFVSINVPPEIIAHHGVFIDCCLLPPPSSPPVSCNQEADESLNFEEQILEAAKSIAAATSALVKAASAAQRELVAQGKVRLKRW